MDLELAGRVALVTGATRGIGRAIAGRLGQEGCSVALCARDADAVAATVAELDAQGVAAFGAALDVTDDARLGGVRRRGGRCAGRPGRRRGQRGRHRGRAGAHGGGGRRLAPHDGAERRPRCGAHPRCGPPPERPRRRRRAHRRLDLRHAPAAEAQYAAAKAAEIHLAASLGRELGPTRIRVNTLSPGSILFEGGSWDRRRNEAPDAFAAFRDRVPLRPPGDDRRDRRRRRVPALPARELDQRHRASSSTAARTTGDGWLVSAEDFVLGRDRVAGRSGRSVGERR